MLKAHGIEIVAFVSSVGKVHLPSFDAATSIDDDKDEEPLSKEYVQLLKTISREEVDKEMVRCPNREIAQKMEDVGLFFCIYPRSQPLLFSKQTTYTFETLK